MIREDPEAFLRALAAPLSRARRDQPLPGVPFSREAVANAFVMLGLLPEGRAEEILAGYRAELEAKGFRFGVLTGELSVRPGAHGYQAALAASRDDLTGIPLAVTTGPAAVPFGGADLVLTWATLTPGGVKLRLRAVIPDPGESARRPLPGRPGLQMAEEIRFELPGQRFAAEVRSGLSVTDDLGRTYRLHPVNWGDSLGDPGQRRWQGEVLAHLWARQARRRARDNEPERAGLAVTLPLQRATAVIESISAHDELVSIQLYGHPWVWGEYWPMITPCFRVHAVDDAGGEHRGMPGSGGGSPEGSREFWFWPPVPAAARRIRVTVSTLWEAARAELDIPGR